MIKLIACDMDGTLLDSAKRLPPSSEVIAKLEGKGRALLRRQRAAIRLLRRDFDAYADDMLFICENGALVMQRDQRMLIDPIDPSFISSIVTATKSLEGVYPVVCRAGVALIEKTASDEFIRNTRMYYPSVEVVEGSGPRWATCRTSRKVAFYDEGDAQTHELPCCKRSWKGAAVDHPLRRALGRCDEARREQGLRDARHPAEAGHFGRRVHAPSATISTTASFLQAVGETTPWKTRIRRSRRWRIIAPSNDENGVMRVVRAALEL